MHSRYTVGIAKAVKCIAIIGQIGYTVAQTIQFMQTGQIGVFLFFVGIEGANQSAKEDLLSPTGVYIHCYTLFIHRSIHTIALSSKIWYVFYTILR